MTINLWGTPLDPQTGLPQYPVRTQSTVTALNQRAKNARSAMGDLQSGIDLATSAFEEAFSETDRTNATRERIAAHAKTARRK